MANQGTNTSESMSAEQASTPTGQQGGTLVPPAEVPNPAASDSGPAMWGIVLIVSLIVAAASLVFRRRSGGKDRAGPRV